ncbi:Sac2 family-domain-containing protein [Syncephalis pseudoplumigaleata]|uniref:Sac2 family-domain-containing protein n=1 Tax=Syncephalis pseudoplumigaleata TaxID=1712513 RepID=A0A4P9Z467_9FUNG|nr:Sac2 family-domain-containing protein [Syncephalis pseudoplumigaleata]|eukprot:RKP27208.1 Sac2 family-domain-containing protein [Syncephalis pseudoplumigaleata]
MASTASEPVEDARLAKDVRKHAVEVAEELRALERVMEETLLGFQTSLAEVSRGIMHIQQSSATMTQHLHNRKVGQQALDRNLTKLVVPLSLVATILQHPVDDPYMDALAILHAKLQYARRLEMDKVQLPVDLRDALERLRLAYAALTFLQSIVVVVVQATARVRKFLLEKADSLRVPNTNVQIIQQAVLLRHQPAFRFLRRWHVEAATEILQSYVNAMMLYYLDNFDQYSRGLWRLLPVDAALVFTTYRSAMTAADLFRATERKQILASTEGEVILAHMAEGSATLPLEKIIRSIHAALRDNACAEFVFILQFFIHRSEAEGAEIFAKVFQPTLKALLADIRHAVDNSFDIVGLIMSVRVLEQIGIEMERRQLSILDNHLQEAMMLIWPKYQLLIDRIARNIRELPVKKLTNNIQIGPHTTTIKFAALVAAILELSLGPNDGVVQNSVLKLRSEFNMLLDKMAASFSVPLDRHAFFINNIAAILSKLAHVSDEEPLLAHYQQSYETYVAEFVEQVLDQHFPELAHLARAAESAAPSLPNCDQDQLARISQDFNERWTSEIDELSRQVQLRISSHQAQIELMQAILSRLMAYYTHFYLLLEQVLDIHALDWTPLGVQTLMVDIKRLAFQ